MPLAKIAPPFCFFDGKAICGLHYTPSSVSQEVQSVLYLFVTLLETRSRRYMPTCRDHMRDLVLLLLLLLIIIIIIIRNLHSAIMPLCGYRGAGAIGK